MGINGMSGKYFIQRCKEDGTVEESPNAGENGVANMVSNPLAYHCDGLKLAAYCHKENGCLSQERIQACEYVRGDICDVDCSGASAIAHSAANWLCCIGLSLYVVGIP